MEGGVGCHSLHADNYVQVEIWGAYVRRCVCPCGFGKARDFEERKKVSEGLDDGRVGIWMK